MKIEEMTAGEIAAFVEGVKTHSILPGKTKHPMLGKRCIIRTYSAGVHIGEVVEAQGREVLLKEALRLWKWEGGGLSLSHLANEGIVRGRLNRTGDIYLTEAIELIPTTERAEESFERFIETT